MNDSLHDAIQNLLPRSLDDAIRKDRAFGEALDAMTTYDERRV